MQRSPPLTSLAPPRRAGRRYRVGDGRGALPTNPRLSWRTCRLATAQPPARCPGWRGFSTDKFWYEWDRGIAFLREVDAWLNAQRMMSPKLCARNA